MLLLPQKGRNTFFGSLAMLYELKGEPGRAADELEEYLRMTPGAANAAQVKEDPLDSGRISQDRRLLRWREI